MNKELKISIAMAVYNGERFLQEQLDSFLRQTRLPDELVVSDNASTDRTLDIVREFATHAPFTVRIFINDRNLGINKNFERAIQECSGDIIFLSDSDDVWYSHKIARMEAALREAPAANVAVSDCDLADEKAVRLDKTLWQALRFAHSKNLKRNICRAQRMLRRIPFHGNCMAFRAGRKATILPFPEFTGWHDYFIALAITYSCDTGVALVNEPLIAYRLHPSQAAGVKLSSRAASMHGHWTARSSRPLDLRIALLKRLEEIRALPGSSLTPIGLNYLRHWRARYELPPHRLSRVGVVARELVSLRYHRFSNGMFSAVKDLLLVD